MINTAKLSAHTIIFTTFSSTLIEDDTRQVTKGCGKIVSDKFHGFISCLRTLVIERQRALSQNRTECHNHWNSCGSILLAWSYWERIQVHRKSAVQTPITKWVLAIVSDTHWTNCLARFEGLSAGTSVEVIVSGGRCISWRCCRTRRPCWRLAAVVSKIRHRWHQVEYRIEELHKTLVYFSTRRWSKKH